MNKNINRCCNSKGPNKNNYAAFWEKFEEVLSKRGNPFVIQPNQIDYSGFSWAKVNDEAVGYGKEPFISINKARGNYFYVKVHIPNDKQLFHIFKARETEIEKMVKMKLNWDANGMKDNAQASLIRSTQNVSFFKYCPETWETTINELIPIVKNFIEAFQKTLNGYIF